MVHCRNGRSGEHTIDVVTAGKIVDEIPAGDHILVSSTPVSGRPISSLPGRTRTSPISNRDESACSADPDYVDALGEHARTVDGFADAYFQHRGRLGGLRALRETLRQSVASIEDPQTRHHRYALLRGHENFEPILEHLGDDDWQTLSSKLLSVFSDCYAAKPARFGATNPGLVRRRCLGHHPNRTRWIPTRPRRRSPNGCVLPGDAPDPRSAAVLARIAELCRARSSRRTRILAQPIQVT